jgi:F-type H+-transporting ATPase subunit b
MPQLDPTTYLPQIFWLVVAFAVLYWVSLRVALPRVADVLQTRRERIETDLERAEAVRKEAAATLEAYESEMAEARAKAHQLTVEASQRIAADAARQNDELTRTLAEQSAAAEARIDARREEAIAEMREVARELVREASQRLAGLTPSEESVEAALAEAGGQGRA